MKSRNNSEYTNPLSGVPSDVGLPSDALDLSVRNESVEDITQVASLAFRLNPSYVVVEYDNTALTEAGSWNPESQLDEYDDIGMELHDEDGNEVTFEEAVLGDYLRIPKRPLFKKPGPVSEMYINPASAKTITPTEDGRISFSLQPDTLSRLHDTSQALSQARPLTFTLNSDDPRVKLIVPEADDDERAVTSKLAGKRKRIRDAGAVILSGNGVKPVVTERDVLSQQQQAVVWLNALDRLREHPEIQEEKYIEEYSFLRRGIQDVLLSGVLERDTQKKGSYAGVVPVCRDKKDTARLHWHAFNMMHGKDPNASQSSWEKAQKVIDASRRNKDTIAQPSPGWHSYLYDVSNKYDGREDYPYAGMEAVGIYGAAPKSLIVSDFHPDGFPDLILGETIPLPQRFLDQFEQKATSKMSQRKYDEREKSGKGFTDGGIDFKKIGLRFSPYSDPTGRKEPNLFSGDWFGRLSNEIYVEPRQEDNWTLPLVVYEEELFAQEQSRLF